MAERFCVSQALCKSVTITTDTLTLHMLGIEPKRKRFVMFLGAEVMLISTHTGYFAFYKGKMGIVSIFSNFY